MHYTALIDGRERSVEIVEIEPGRFKLTLDGRELVADARRLSESRLSVLLQDVSYDVHTHPHPEGGDVLSLNGVETRVEVLDARRMTAKRAREARGTHDGPLEVASPMPGKVVAVLVQPGDQVVEGQGLVVVEAMKMENELRATKAGQVTHVHVAEGQAVDGGALLCVIE